MCVFFFVVVEEKAEKIKLVYYSNQLRDENILASISFPLSEILSDH